MASASKQQEIRDLEKSVVRGDIPAMARLISSLHENWDSVPAHEQQDIMKLEAVFLTMVSLHVQGNA